MCKLRTISTLFYIKNLDMSRFWKPCERLIFKSELSPRGSCFGYSIPTHIVTLFWETMEILGGGT